MKWFISICVISVFCCSLCACTSIPVHSNLIAADKLMMERPDSALKIIERIDISPLWPKRLRAQYSLLHTMAIDRNGIDTTNIALIRDAAGYYESHGKPIDRARAFYYQGRLLYNKGDYTSSLISFRKALKYADQTDNNWVKGMIYSLMGSIYNSYLNKNEELQCSKLAMHYFTLYGDSTYINNANYRLAVAYHNNRDFDKADSLYELVSSIDHYTVYCLLGLARNEISRNPPDSKQSVFYYEEAINNGASLTLSDWYQYSYALILNGEEKSADRFISRVNGYPDDAKTLWWKYSIAKAKGKFSDALSVFEKYSLQRDSIMSARVAQSLYRAESDYYASEARETERTVSYLRQTLFSLLSIVILIAVIVVLLWQKKQLKAKEQRAELEKKLEQLQDLLNNESERCDQDEQLSNLRRAFVSMYQKQFAKIGALYNTNLEISFNMDKDLRNQVIDILDEISSGEKQPLFEERINHDLDNIMIKLRTDFPELDESSFRLLSFIIVGFKDTSIATIMNDNNSTIRTRKSRLKEKVLSKQSPNAGLYELFLSNQRGKS